MEIDGTVIPVIEGEFWTSRQRGSHSLHEISYRACFKPELPGFFIELLSKRGDTIYDPFSGRGTTALEAGLLDRNVIANDANPLSSLLTIPRFFPPSLEDLHARLEKIPKISDKGPGIDLSMFYENETLREITALKGYLIDREKDGV